MSALCVISMIAQARDRAFISVPEPSTIIAGVALLVPFGISTVRVMLKNRRNKSDGVPAMKP
jgi:hypothetical protein